MNSHRKSKIRFFSLLSILSVLSLISMGQTGPDTRGGQIGFLLPLIGLIITVLLVPFFKAYIASKSTERLKTLVFITTFYEWLGWIICITIIGIPIGFGLVLSAQTVRLLINIEDNTRQATKLLQSIQKS